MPKKILADMVPGRTKNNALVNKVKSAPIPKTTKKSVLKTKFEPKVHTDNTADYLNELSTIKKNRKSYSYDDGICEADMPGHKNNKEGNKNSLWIIAFVSIVFLFFAFSSMFAKAKVVVEPKTQSIALSTHFSAFKDTNSEDLLPFSLVSLSGEEKTIIMSTEEKDTKEVAKGKIMLYNNFSTSSQDLAIDTRVEGSNGKIYKTEKVVTIPGVVKADLAKGVKENIPGSVEVSVYATEAGVEYNTYPIDFKIVGFKGTSKYDKFYGRGKGDISGGLKGKLNFISEEDKTKAENELKTVLEEKLRNKVIEEIPEGYVLFKNATIFKADSTDTRLAYTEKEVPFVLSGTLYGFLFEEKSLTKKIVESAVQKYDGSNVFVPNISDLVFSVTLPVGTDSYSSINDIDFSLSGNAKVVWEVNEELLKSKLISKPKGDFNKILSEFANIDKANLTLSPVWKRTIPSKLKDIKITVNN